jgi:hypothetical protein
MRLYDILSSLNPETYGIVPESKYGLRQDGTPKGEGWLGELKRPDGDVMTELTVGTDVNGKDMDIPTMVPTLSPEEIQYLLFHVYGNKGVFDTPVGKSILQKAIEHATMRNSSGLSPFKD